MTILKYIVVLVIFGVLMAGVRWLASKSSDAKSLERPDDEEDRIA